MAAWNPYMPSWWQSALLTPPNPEDEWPVTSPPPASGFEFSAADPFAPPSTSLPHVDNPRQDFSDVMWMGLPVQPLLDGITKSAPVNDPYWMGSALPASPLFGGTGPTQWSEPRVPTAKSSVLSVHSDVGDSFERTFNDRYSQAPRPDGLISPLPAMRAPSETMWNLAWDKAKSIAPHLTSWKYLTTPPGPPSSTPDAAGKIPMVDNDPRVAGVLGDLANIGMIAAPFLVGGPPTLALRGARAVNTMKPRYTTQYEPYYRYEIGDPVPSRVTSDRGLLAETFAGRVDNGVQPQSRLNYLYNLPQPQLARRYYYHVNTPPGQRILGPRPVKGGFDDEVQFLDRVRGGSVGPRKDTPP